MRAAEIKEQLLDHVQAAIAKARQGGAVSQADLARRIGYTQPRLSSLVQDHGELFSIEALINVAERLGLQVQLRATRAYRRK